MPTKTVGTYAPPAGARSAKTIERIHVDPFAEAAVGKIRIDKKAAAVGRKRKGHRLHAGRRAWCHLVVLEDDLASFGIEDHEPRRLVIQSPLPISAQ